MLQRVLVPLDGSRSAKAVLPFLRRLPVKAETRIILARVVEPGRKDPGPVSRRSPSNSLKAISVRWPGVCGVKASSLGPRSGVTEWRRL